MMRSKLFLMLLCSHGILLLSGCREKSSGSDTDRVPVKIERSGKAFISAVSSLDLVPLETMDGHLLGSSVQLSLLQEGYLLADKKNYKIYRYSADGHFGNEIGRRGKGPGEYIGFCSVQVIDGLVHVFDVSGKEIVYDQDGNLISEKTVPVGFHAYREDTGVLAYYGYSGQREHRLIHESGDGFEKGFLKLDAKLLALDLENEIFSPAADGGVCFIDSFSPTVYVYRDGQVTPHLSFDFGKYSIPETFFRANDAFAAAESLFASDYAVVTSYSEEGEHKLVHLLVKDKGHDENWSEYGVYDGSAWLWFSLSDYTDEALPGPLRFFESGILYGLFTAEELERMGIRETVASCDRDTYVVAKIHI